VRINVLMSLLLKELNVEVGEMLVHIFATGIGEVLAVEQPGLKLSKLDQAEAEGRVAQIEEEDVPHLL